MSDAAMGLGLITVLWNIFLFILSICLIVAVFNISGATQRSARELARANLRISMITHHLNIREDDFQPPCAQCLKRGKEVKLERVDARTLRCPECRGTRRDPFVG